MLCYMSHELTDNRHDLAVNAGVRLTTDTAEHDAAGLALADAASCAARHHGRR